MERKPLHGTADVVLEMLMHAAFLLSLSVLLTSPISGDYTDFGVFRRYSAPLDHTPLPALSHAASSPDSTVRVVTAVGGYRTGSGYDCDNGFGIGTEAYRVLAAHLAALYTGRDPTTTSRSAPDTLIADALGCCCVGCLRRVPVRVHLHLQSEGRRRALHHPLLLHALRPAHRGPPRRAHGHRGAHPGKHRSSAKAFTTHESTRTDMPSPWSLQSAFCACCCTRKRREDTADEAVDKTKLGFQVVIEDDEDIYEEGRRQ